tara:strand:- start:124 stop:435 length:312 start_codon:yes stop_codon:yes gene_type:complete
MQIGKPTRCYPFRKETGDFMFIPYDYTEADLTYIGGSRNALEKIENFWDSIGNPMYKKQLSFEDNMLNVYNQLRYWPKPMFNNNVVQTIILEYEYDNRRTERI